jgi:hypothetical protein
LNVSTSLLFGYFPGAALFPVNLTCQQVGSDWREPGQDSFMRIFLVPFLSASLLLLKGCDLNDMAGKKPEQIQHAAEQQLIPYFPKAKVMVQEQQRTILAMTCVPNVGKAFLEQMVPVLEKSEGVRQLKEYRANYAGLEGFSRMLGMKLVTYRYFALGFDRYIIRLDADTQQHAILPVEQVAHYPEDYSHQCTPPAPPTEVSSAQKAETSQHVDPPAKNVDAPPDPPYIWIGTFMAITHKNGDSADEQSSIKETLGIYTEAEFASSRSDEIADRERMIRHKLEQKQLEVKSLSLRQVERAPVPQQSQFVDIKTGI